MSNDIFSRLYNTVLSRKEGDPETSYTARLYAHGTNRIAQKVGEEAVETVIAAVTGDTEHIKTESADLIYHLMVLWASAGIAPSDVAAVLEQREGVSGITEKNNRKVK